MYIQQHVLVALRAIGRSAVPADRLYREIGKALIPHTAIIAPVYNRVIVDDLSTPILYGRQTLTRYI